jgi:putative salt-induced outer membrane protein
MYRAIEHNAENRIAAPLTPKGALKMRGCLQIAMVWYAWVASCACAQVLNPNTDGLWRGALSASLSAAAGNTESTSFNIGAEGARARSIDKLTFYLSGLYGTKNDNGQSAKTAHQIRGGAKYDYNLTESTFVFSTLDLERDRLQELDLRSVVGAGFGTHVIKTGATTFDLFGGLTYNREEFFKETRNSAELLLGEESAHKISASTTLKQRFSLYPNLRDRGEFRAVLDSSMVVAITAVIGLQLTVSDRYISNPQPGIKNNDFLFLTGITVRFGPQ